MTRMEIVKEKLVEQFPDEIQRVEDIDSVRYMPFTQRRAPDAVLATPELLKVQTRTSVSVQDLEERVDVVPEAAGKHIHAVPEASHRWPIFKC